MDLKRTPYSLNEGYIFNTSEKYCFSLYSLTRTAGDPDAVFEAACLESRRSRVRPLLWQSGFKETKCFFSGHS